jgi:FkbM family methyltransferase
VILTDGEIIVDLKCTQSHEARIKMILDPDDVRSVPFSAMCEGFYEKFHADLLFNLGKASSHFLDIGANMGFYSIGLGLENTKLRIEAFEPQCGVLQSLVRNIEINELVGRVNVHNIGLSNQIGELKMYIPKFTGSGGGSFSNLHADEGEAREVIVRVIPLDQHYKGSVDLMKIDVEGFELNVILGGINLIEKHKPTIVIELLRKWMKPFGHHPQDVVRTLLKFGYRCYAIEKSSLKAIERINEETEETNFVFVHSSKSEHSILVSGLLN